MRTAQENAQRNFVGIEQEWERIKKALRRIELLSKPKEGAGILKNVRLLKGDAVVAFERLFKPATVDKIYCLFPCPWPKKCHVKYRLFSHENLKLMNSRLTDRGEIQMVTDYHPYFDWVLDQLGGAGFDVETETIKPQFNTKFEKKWQEAGQKEFFELRLRKKEHVEVPLEEDVEMKVYFSEEFHPDRFQFEDSSGAASMIMKDFLFDKERNRGMLHLVVSEKNITQHVWLSVRLCPKGWRVAKAEGQAVLPTPGVAQALELFYEAVRKTCL